MGCCCFLGIILNSCTGDTQRHRRHGRQTHPQRHAEGVSTLCGVGPRHTHRLLRRLLLGHHPAGCLGCALPYGSHTSQGGAWFGLSALLLVLTSPALVAAANGARGCPFSPQLGVQPWRTAPTRQYCSFGSSPGTRRCLVEQERRPTGMRCSSVMQHTRSHGLKLPPVPPMTLPSKLRLLVGSDMRAKLRPGDLELKPAESDLAVFLAAIEQ